MPTHPAFSSSPHLPPSWRMPAGQQQMNKSLVRRRRPPSQSERAVLIICHPHAHSAVPATSHITSLLQTPPTVQSVQGGKASSEHLKLLPPMPATTIGYASLVTVPLSSQQHHECTAPGSSATDASNYHWLHACLLLPSPCLPNSTTNVLHTTGVVPGPLTDLDIVAYNCLPFVKPQQHRGGAASRDVIGIT
jgi:hypothetical protein